MPSDGTELPALANSLLEGSLHLRRGENLLIETWSHCLPYASACVVEARRLGARPLLLLEDERAYWASLETAPKVRRWSHPGEHEWAALAKADAFVFFPGPSDRPRFRALPPKLRGDLQGYNGEWYRRARAARIRGVRCVLGYASDDQAEHWGVPADEWRRSLIRGTVGVDLPEVVRTAGRVAARLRSGKLLHITAPNGTDIKLTLRRRVPLIDDGVVTPADVAAGRNMTVSPPGTVGVAVDERAAEGTAVANRPSFLSTGRAEGGEWQVARGHLVRSVYTEGQASVDEAFSKAPRGRDVVSIFALGLNPALGPGVAQVEDQERGAVTIGIGGNTEYGGSNRCPFLSWIVVGEATVALDGKPLCDRGHLF